MKWRQALCRGVVLGLLGAATTCVVAWSCALWSPITRRGADPPDPGPDYWPYDEGFGTSRDRGFGYSIEVERIPREFENTEGGIDFVGWEICSLPVRDAGWPLRSLRSVVRAYHDPADRNGYGPALSYPALPIGELVRRGYPTDRLPAWLGARPWRRVPLVPQPVGFGVDSVVFAGMWWVGLTAPVALVRRRRRRLGRCAACGYELGGLETCPECGATP
jgi:hypothetical protein